MESAVVYCWSHCNYTKLYALQIRFWKLFYTMDTLHFLFWDMGLLACSTPAYGFLALYKKKNKESNKLDYYIDTSLLYGGLMLPFLVFVVRYPEASEIINPIVGVVENILGITVVTLVTWLTLGITGILAGIYIGRQIYLVQKGIPINVPKALFLLAVIPLHLFICFSNAVVEAGLFAFGAFVTIFHDIQYHAIVWFHHKIDTEMWKINPNLGYLRGYQAPFHDML